MASPWLAQMLVLAALSSMAAPALAQTCSPMNAQNSYDNMRLNDAIDWLEPCRRRDWWGDLDKGQKTVVLRLLALSYQAKNEPDSSRAVVRVLIRTDRRYRASLADPPFFHALVQEFRPKWYQKRWVQLGGTALVGGVSAYFLTRKKTPPLSEPPGWPTGN